MLKAITPKQEEKINKIMAEMTVREKIGQVQCVNGSGLPTEAIKQLIEREHIGAFFGGNIEKEQLQELYRATKGSKVPVIINGDLVNGAGSRIFGLTAFPQQMGCAASNDEELLREMGRITAEEGRAYGAQWTFGPVIDLCYNLQNPMMHIRTAGDDPQRVMKVGKAYMHGVQDAGYMAATAKHFPGDGFDSRDTHITTLINALDREAWMESYGKLWKEMIKEGVMAVMSGHIALPFIDPEYEDEKERYKGMRPASISKKILVDFLRGELGFDGIIVTDAVNMVGLGAHLKREEYGPRLLNAGNDMLLWTKPEIDTPAIKKALDQGTLSMERLNEAVRKILELKARVGLLEEVVEEIDTDQVNFAEHAKKAQQMADKSITVLRDVFHAIPMRDLVPGARVLTITATFVEGVRNVRDGRDLTVIDEMLKERGFVVDHMVNPDGIGTLSKIKDDYDAIFVNMKYPAKYGTIRLCGDAIAAFKGSWWVEDSKVVFTAFGDPYKIYDLPSLHSYVAAYSVREVSQKAAVKVWLGELEAQGKCPIDMSQYL